MILVTGATGFVGSHLLAELLICGNKVRATRRVSSKTDQVDKIFEWYAAKQEVISDSLEWIEADLLDPVDVEMVMREIDTVYHTAATVSFNPRERNEMLRNNTGITRNIVNACLGKNIKKLIYLSSTAALGTALDGNEVTEDSPWTDDKKRTSYSLSKYQSEIEVWRGIAEGLDAVIVNPSIIMGYGDWNRSSPRLFKAVWEGLNYYTEGVTGYVDIRDVVRTMTDPAVTENSGERYIVSSENVSYKEILQMIAKAFGKPPPAKLATPFLLGIAWRLDWLRGKMTGKERTITRETARAGRNKKYFSSKKIKDTTGIQFIPVSKSIKDTAEILMANQVKN